MKIITLLVLLITHGVVIAGGSFENVELLQFTTYGENRYLLVVKPMADGKSNYKDPYMGNCKIFSVVGGYRELGIFEGGNIPSINEYLKAIEYLRTNPKPLRLGWMGGGFKVLNPNNPCVVTSRSLKIIEEQGVKAVVSWFNGT